MRKLLFKFLAFFLLGFSLGASAFCQTLNIHRLKANYLIAFTEFVRWGDKLETENVTIAFFGSKELARELRSITHNKTEGRPIKILKLENIETDRLHYIDIIFVSAGYAKQWRAIKEHCKEYKILVVGEHSRFIEEDGGAIQLAFRKNRLRFYADQENAKQQGVELSSKLLELAIE